MSAWMWFRRVAGWVMAGGAWMVFSGCQGTVDQRAITGAYTSLRVEGPVNVDVVPVESQPAGTLRVSCASMTRAPNVEGADPDVTLVHTEVRDQVLVVRSLASPVKEPRGPRGLRLPRTPRCWVVVPDDRVFTSIRHEGTGTLTGGRAAEFILAGPGTLQNGQPRGADVAADVALFNLGRGLMRVRAPLTTGKVTVVNSGGGELRVGEGEGGWGIARSVDARQEGPGSLELRMDLVMEESLLVVEGSGTLWAAGQARKVEAHLDGTGKLNADNLPARDAEVWAHGTGLVRVRADGTVRTFTRGPVTVEVAGNPGSRTDEDLGPELP